MSVAAARLHECYLVTPFNLEAAIRAATEGDVQSAQLSLLAIGNMLRDILQRGDVNPLKCLCSDCNFEFTHGRNPVAFAVLIPMFPEAGQFMAAQGICINCFDRDDLEVAIESTLHAMFPRVIVRKPDEWMQ